MAARQEPCLICGGPGDFVGMWTLGPAQQRLLGPAASGTHVHTLCRRCIELPGVSHLIDQRIMQRVAARN